MAYLFLPRRSPRWAWVLCSALLTFVVMLVIALLLREPYLRWQHLRYLQSADAGLRADGLQYVARRAGGDATLRTAAGRLVAELPIERAERLIGALQRAGAWGPDLPRGYLRWLRHLAAGDASGRAGVARELAAWGMRGHAIMTRPEAAALVEQLLADDTAGVRVYALAAAAGLPTEQARSLIQKHLAAEHPAVRRQARLLAEVSGMTEAPSAAPPPHGDSTDALLRRLDGAPVSAATESDRLAWRAILSVPVNAQTRPALLDLARRPRTADDAPKHSPDAPPAPTDDGAGGQDAHAWPRKTEPLRAAAISRVAAMLPWEAVRDTSAFSRLAWLESTTPARISAAELDLARLSPLMQAAVARAVGDTLSAEQWRRVFETDLASVRHLLVLAALDHLSPAALDGLIDQLSRGFYDGQRMAAALLIALRKRDTPGDPLTRMQRDERQWVVQRHLVLARMVRAANPDALAEQIDALLTRDRFPRTTALLVGLHTGLPSALDELLQPLDPRRALVRAMLDQYRMACILNRYLPTDQRPGFDLYADGAWQAWQVDRLRAWYLVHRRHLRFDPARRQFVPTREAR